MSFIAGVQFSLFLSYMSFCLFCPLCRDLSLFLSMCCHVSLPFSSLYPRISLLFFFSRFFSFPVRYLISLSSLYNSWEFPYFFFIIIFLSRHFSILFALLYPTSNFPLLSVFLYAIFHRIPSFHLAVSNISLVTVLVNDLLISQNKLTIDQISLDTKLRYPYTYKFTYINIIYIQ